MKNSILIIFFLSLIGVSFAQIDVAPTEVKNGVTFYVHTVQKSQTAYGLSKMYKVSVGEIYKYNPTSKDGLSIGEVLYIPSSKKPTTKVTPVVVTAPVEGLQNEVFEDTTELTHVVKSGETLYFIAKKYSISLENLKAANTGASANLKIGDKLTIPLDKVNKNNVVNPIVKNPINPTVSLGDSVIVHKVKRGETLYSLTKLYGVDEASIREENGGLVDGLKRGELIRIVVKKKEVSVPVQYDSIADSTQSDTLSLLPFDPDSLFNVNVKRNVYEVAVMLPFMFEEDVAFRKKCPAIGDCPHYGYTTMSLNYYNGFLIAVDSLRKAGMNVKINVFDTKNDVTTVKLILAKSELDSVDLIFGPLFPESIKVVAQFTKARGIQNIIPVPVSNKALYKNASVSKFMASTPTKVAYMGSYVAENHKSDNVIVVINKESTKDQYYAKVFIESYNEKMKEIGGTPLDSNKIVRMYSSTKLTSVERNMLGERTNVIIVPSSDLGHVSNFMTKLSTTTNRNPYSRYVVQVYGLEDWMDFETIDEKYKNRYSVRMPSGGLIDYHSPEVYEFIKSYRIRFGTDPSQHAFSGFDASFVNLKGLYLYGTNFAELGYVNLENPSGLFSPSKYVKVEADSGYENQGVFMIEYNNYVVKRVQ
ncbi:MAG: LysM repeat protein [Chitinophagales bacterium]|jgi:LysM repeat protein